MWRMTPRLATATLTATLAIAFATALEAKAASVQSYSYTTSGSISGPSNAPITFQPEFNAADFTTPGSLVLGSFTTNPLPTTATLTYDETPFTIDLKVAAPLGYSSLGTYQYVISGVLNGSISGDGTSSMMATINGITGSGSGQAITPPFPISDLQVNLPQGIAAPNGNYQGTTTLTAQVSVTGSSIPGLPSPAPEPSTIAIFGLALAGWAGYRRSRPKG